MVTALVLALCVAIMTPTWLMITPRRIEASRALLWVGLIAPFSLGAQREGQDLGVGLVDALRFGVPIACLILASVATRPLWRRNGSPEWWLASFLFAALISTVWSVGPLATLLKALVLVVQFAI